ncbi:hypothetical protein M413DRAFT_439067 [Hebeloma cylindrosporum]|uniref:F-box domain-containing protein n=1 Tax=Hebeloma cylindrosporum TaxID=76867 RepID=A0A0C2Z2C3_HEBCY|nr:hypothetical protein M413DRAFT_439067 [Hebeloma cylindrosporum h7]
MVLCTRCQELDVKTSVRATNCSIVGGGPCSACKEDMELEQKIQELQEKRRHLRTKMNANHDPFVLRLPPEIASHIFCLSMDELDAPYLFGAVCRGWRQLARSTPQLWSRLAFSLPHPMESKKMETVPHLILDWLELSGGLPLSLQVSSHASHSHGLATNGLSSIINVLNQHSGRWRDIVFSLPPAYLRHFCPTSPPKNLRNISIFGIGVTDPHSESPWFSMNSGPGPIKFRLEYIPLKAVDIVWDRLVRLKVRDTSLDGVLQVIRDAPLLKVCSLTGISPPTADISNGIIYHPHLATLALLEMRLDVFTTIINLLELPSLKSCSFGSDVGHSAIGVDAISFLRRFGSGLTSLQLHQDQELPIADFNQLLQAAPHIQHLKLAGEGLSSAMDDVLERLAASSLFHDAGFFSKLQSLEFFVCSRLNAWAYISPIFRSPHRKLLSLDIKVDLDDSDTRVSNELAQLVDQGIKLRIYDLYRGEDCLQKYREFKSGN